MTQQMTVKDARQSVHDYMSYVGIGCQMDAAIAERYLPRGWHFVEMEDGDLYPMTVKNLTTVFRAHARRDE
jgi:hypothetical protein